MASDWHDAESSKGFYVQLFRRSVLFLFISVVLNTLLGAGIFYMYLTKPEPAYYSTNGITAPVRLRMMMTPNYSSKALLKSDPKIVDEDKELPS